MINERVVVTPDVLSVHQTYRDIDGNKLPGFSAVSGVLAKPALINWAWKQGKDGIDLGKSQQRAFDIGTAAHFMVECHVNGWVADLGDFSPNDISQAENSFIKFLDFWEGKFELVGSELQMASSEFGYGGTADIIARDKDGRLCIIDLKTSKAVYPEYEMQLCAYSRLWNSGDVEMINGEPALRPLPSQLIDRMICVRIGKEESGDVEVHEVKWSKYADYLALFDHALSILKLKRNLKWR